MLELIECSRSRLSFDYIFFKLVAATGMSKTASMATMAIKWVKGEEELKHFDFVFPIRFGFVDKTSTLAELVIR